MMLKNFTIAMIQYGNKIGSLEGLIAATMATGVVKWFNNDKGYGFVMMDGEDQNEVFVHHSAIDMEGFKTLRHGQRVEFSLYYGHKGLTASYLKPLVNTDGEVIMDDEGAANPVSPPASLP